MPSVVIVPADELLAKNISTIEQIKVLAGPVIAVTSADLPAGLADAVIRVPRGEPELEPLLLNVPLQLLAYHVAAKLGRDIDKPRNLAKSVTSTAGPLSVPGRGILDVLASPRRQVRRRPGSFRAYRAADLTRGGGRTLAGDRAGFVARISPMGPPRGPPVKIRHGHGDFLRLWPRPECELAYVRASRPALARPSGSASGSEVQARRVGGASNAASLSRAAWSQ